MENKKGFKKYIFTGYIILFAILAISRIDVLELKNLAHLTQTCYILGITGIAVTLIALPVSVMKKKSERESSYANTVLLCSNKHRHIHFDP